MLYIFCFALLLLLSSLTRRRELKYPCSTGVYENKCECEWGIDQSRKKKQAKKIQTNKQIKEPPEKNNKEHCFEYFQIY